MKIHWMTNKNYIFEGNLTKDQTMIKKLRQEIENLEFRILIMEEKGLEQILLEKRKLLATYQ